VGATQLLAPQQSTARQPLVALWSALRQAAVVPPYSQPVLVTQRTHCCADPVTHFHRLPTTADRSPPPPLPLPPLIDTLVLGHFHCCNLSQQHTEEEPGCTPGTGFQCALPAACCSHQVTHHTLGVTRVCTKKCVVTPRQTPAWHTS
jgi:hypothetical protein